MSEPVFDMPMEAEDHISLVKVAAGLARRVELKRQLTETTKALAQLTDLIVSLTKESDSGLAFLDGTEPEVKRALELLRVQK